MRQAIDTPHQADLRPALEGIDWPQIERWQRMDPTCPRLEGYFCRLAQVSFELSEYQQGELSLRGFAHPVARAYQANVQGLSDWIELTESTDQRPVLIKNPQSDRRLKLAHGTRNAIVPYAGYYFAGYPDRGMIRVRRPLILTGKPELKDWLDRFFAQLPLASLPSWGD